MKPLVLWCRWHDASLRLAGRDAAAVWGELAFPDKAEKFRFEFKGARLLIGEGDEQRELRLDEMGVELRESLHF